MDELRHETQEATETEKMTKTMEVVLKRVPESVLVSFLRFWEDSDKAEWSINRHDGTWKVKTGGYEKGSY